MKSFFQVLKSNWPIVLGILAIFIYSFLNAFFTAQQRSKQQSSQTHSAIPAPSVVPSFFSSATDNFKVQFPTIPKQTSGSRTVFAVINIPYKSYDSESSQAAYSVNVMTMRKELLEDGTPQERIQAGIDAVEDKDTSRLSSNVVTFKNQPAIEAQFMNIPNKYYIHLLSFENGLKSYTLMTVSRSDSNDIGKDFFESFEFLSNE